MTREFVGESIADESPLEEGIFLIPAYATPNAPPEVSAGSAAVYVNDAWSTVADWRGKTLYATADGRARVVTDLGDEPNVEYTDKEYPGAAYAWSGSEWVLDAARQTALDVSAATAKRNGMRAKADAAILPLQDAVDLGIATGSEAAALTAWKSFRVAVNRVDPSSASIVWPTEPETS